MLLYMTIKRGSSVPQYKVIKALLPNLSKAEEDDEGGQHFPENNHPLPGKDSGMFSVGVVGQRERMPAATIEASACSLINEVEWKVVPSFL